MGFAWHKLYSIVITEAGEIICIESPYQCVGTPTSGTVCYNTGYGAGGTTASDGVSVGPLTGDNQTICITVTGNACDFYGDNNNNPYAYGRILPTDISYSQSGQWWFVYGLTSAANGPLAPVYGNMNQYPWCPIDIRFECPMNCWRPNEAGYSGGNFCHTDLQTSNGAIPFYLRSPSSPSSIPGYINLQRIGMYWTERLRYPTSQSITAQATNDFLDDGKQYRSKQVRILVVSGYNREHFMGSFVLTGGLGCPGNGKTAYNQGIDANYLNFGGRPNLKTARNTIVWGSTTGSGWHSTYDQTEFVRGVSGIRDMELSLGRDFPLSHEVMAYPLFGGWNMVNYSPTGDIVTSGSNGSEPVECTAAASGCLQSRCRRCNYPPDPWTGVGHYTPYISYAGEFSPTEVPDTGVFGYGGCTGNGLTQPYPICPGHTSTHDKNGQGIGPFSFACFNAHSYFNSTGVGDWYYHESPDVGNQGIPACSVWSLLHAIYYRVHADLTSNIGITSAPVHIHRNITPDSWKNLDPSALTGPSGNFQMVRYVMERFADAVKNQGLPRDINDIVPGASASTGGFVDGGPFSGYHSGGIKGPNWNFIYPNVFLWDRDNYLNAPTNADKWKHIYTIGNSNIIYDSQVNRDLPNDNGTSYTGHFFQAIFELDECSHQALPGSTHNARFIGFGSADSGITAGPAQTMISVWPRMITCGTGTDETDYWESLCSYWSSLCDPSRQGGPCNVTWGSPPQYNWAYDPRACAQCNLWANHCPDWLVTRGNLLRTSWNPGSGAVTITTVYDGCGLTNL